MPKKQKLLMCPACGRKLLTITGNCSNVYIICEDCESSLLFNIEDNGCMKISLRPSDYSENALQPKTLTTTA